MYIATHSEKVTGLSVEQIWEVWSDVNNWHTWQSDIEYAKLNSKFIAGNVFVLKPKNGPRINVELIKVEQNKIFIDLTRFPLAKMYGIHEFICHGEKLELKVTIKVEGWFSFIWWKLVAEKIVNSSEEQTKRLLAQVIKLNKGA